MTTTLTAAMPWHGAPEGADARWVGLLDLDTVQLDGSDLVLAGGADYTGARLLVREGGVVRGYLAARVVEGRIAGADLATGLAGLPPAEPAA
ncbi:hypothetical protein, partial [Propionicimonas sp.]|uniref:hypothetical protein n=1 Tax=Propionicimonas sp. TaxID=1955623 RepID=UPI0039E3A581